MASSRGAGHTREGGGASVGTSVTTSERRGRGRSRRPYSTWPPIPRGGSGSSTAGSSVPGWWRTSWSSTPRGSAIARPTRTGDSPRRGWTTCSSTASRCCWPASGRRRFLAVRSGRRAPDLAGRLGPPRRQRDVERRRLEHGDVRPPRSRAQRRDVKGRPTASGEEPRELGVALVRQDRVASVVVVEDFQVRRVAGAPPAVREGGFGVGELLERHLPAPPAGVEHDALEALEDDATLGHRGHRRRLLDDRAGHAADESRTADLDYTHGIQADDDHPTVRLGIELQPARAGEEEERARARHRGVPIRRPAEPLVDQELAGGHERV